MKASTKDSKNRQPFVTRVELFVSAEDLANMDELDESDPFCRFSSRTSLNDPWKVQG